MGAERAIPIGRVLTSAELKEITDKFIVKDSGNREKYASGMYRDTETNKVDYDLIYDGPMLERWAAHLTKGAKKYERRNWMKANSEVELDRFKRSAIRHFTQWVRGEMEEDHAAAVLFNINCYEYVKDLLTVRTETS